MSPPEEKRLAIIAPNYPWALNWLRENRPELNPRRVLFLTDAKAGYKVRGSRAENYEIVNLGLPDGRHGSDLWEALFSRGWLS